MEISIFITVFGAYLFTVSPGIYWRDSAEFAASAFELGITHPAGSPLYSCVANLFTYLPFGSIPFRVNLVSVFFCALTVIILYRTLLEILSMYLPHAQGKTAQRAIAAFASLSFAFSRSFWDISTIAEVYSLQNFFIILILYLFVRLYQKKLSGQKPEYELYAIAFLFGLSSGAHIIMLIYFPAIVFSIFLLGGKRLFTIKNGAVFLFFMILGGSIYIYLPVRSSVNPFWDWGNTETFRNFRIHVTDKKDSEYHFSFSFDVFRAVLSRYLGFYWADFSLAGIILGITGIACAVYKDIRLVIFFGIMVIAQWLFFIRYWGWSSQYVPNFMVFSIFIGIGTGFLITLLSDFLKEKNKTAFTGAVLCTAGLLQLGLSASLNGNEVKKDWAPREFFISLLSDIKDGSVIFSEFTYFGLSYLLYVESFNPTVSIISAGDIFAPEVFNPIDSRRFPLLDIPETKGLTNAQIGAGLVLANKERQFRWEPSIKLDIPVFENLIPDGFFYTLSTRPRSFTEAELAAHHKKIAAELERGFGAPGLRHDPNENEIVFIKLVSLAHFFIKKGRPDVAISHLTAAEQIFPDHVSYNYAELLNMMGVAYAQLGEYDKANEFFSKAATAPLPTEGATAPSLPLGATPGLKLGDGG